ncbi:uncharacterized protein LOC106181966 isoform X3 [Lingula anatina]|uniref:Uncharacterized protein LOC106181966 isoform X3 n=1 Tax=Lingula anatina TaxID=7574 RepID=A0A1S3KIG2_LINAN|nr:uncharacterized protein LOC106181966 isoform X3 [Lingula anatina]|eukprot:XP_013422001.1 uncharacterized protein LOC106181966 isoform X3 [Lingula anatina]
MRWGRTAIQVAAAFAVVLVIIYFNQRLTLSLRPLGVKITHLTDVSRENTREVQGSQSSNLDKVAVVVAMDKVETAEIIKHKSQAALMANVPFFKTLLHSFCLTASLGFEYNFYIGFLHTDEDFKKSGQMLIESFVQTMNHSWSHSVKATLVFAAVPNFENKALAVIDTMRLAFMQNNNYFYLVDSKMKMESKRWTENFTEMLSKSRPAANLGIVLPSVASIDAKSPIPFSFVHRRHFDIFGLFYLFEARKYGDWWLKQVYDNKYFVNPEVKVSCEKSTITVAIPAGAELDAMNAVVKSSKHLIDRWVEGAQVKPNANRVISFSLYGDSPRYAFGAIRNAQLARLFLPQWTARFYVVGKGTKYPTPGEGTVQHLKRLGAEILTLDAGTVNKLAPMLWRFLPGDDSRLEAYIVRDTDSRLSEREANLIQEWMTADTAFHCIRDHPSHGNYAISGGLFGGKPKKLKKLLDHSWGEMMAGYGAGYIQDMNFLNAVIWPKVKTDSLCHDSVSCIKYPKTAPIVAPRDKYFHIGAVFNEYDQMRQGDVNILKNAGVNKACTNLEMFKQKQG